MKLGNKIAVITGGNSSIGLATAIEFQRVPALGARVDYAWTVEQFYKALYKFGFSLTGNESDAADLTQETYFVLLTKGHAILDASKVKSWLFTTLYRQFLGRRRHSTRFPEITIESAEWELPTNTPSLANDLDGSFVVAALQQLEEKYRAPLAMFYLQELSYKEMAELLEMPIGTIMSRISRGKNILRRRLQEPSLTAVTCVNAARNAN
ncbi:MAG: sigma-70 family RNA polymerase sigma factor [Luteolibacter sp.]